MVSEFCQKLTYLLVYQIDTESVVQDYIRVISLALALVYGTAQLKLDTCFVLLVSAYRFYSSHLSMLACYLHVAVVELQILLLCNRI